MTYKLCKYLLPSLLLLLTLLWSSCREDFNFEVNTGNLTFSKDTVFLDTVFTNIGSSTYTLKVFNGLNKDITIPFVGLQNGMNSSYRLNVDGVAGKEFNNVPLLARDSLFVFVETTFDIASTGENEFLNTDRILFGEGPSQQSVELVTLVKDAVFLFPTATSEGTQETIPIGLDDEGNEILVDGFFLEPEELSFTNEKPYVIYGYAAVPSGDTLSMAPGTRVHFHNDSGILVNAGASLQINGQLSQDRELLENEVIFEGDRLEPTFSNVPGQWGSVWIRSGSVNNTIEHLTLKNATSGLVVEGDLTIPEPVLLLSNSQIFNSLEFNLWSTGARILADNSVFGGAGNTSVHLTSGGDYQFVHTTMANYWNNGFRSGVSLSMDNTGGGLERADFSNSIVDGSSRMELLLFQDPSFPFNFRFVNTAIQFEDPNGTFQGNPLYDFNDQNSYINPILNGEMDFEMPFQNEFYIGSASEAIDQGNPTFLINFPNDILGNARDANPDLGAFEKSSNN